MRREHDETARLLRSLDDPAPAISVDDVIQRASQRRFDPAGPRLPWAAVLAGLLVAAGLAAAILPGLPLRNAIEGFIATPPAEDGDRAWREEAGVALVPGPTLEIVFMGEQSQGFIEIVDTDEESAQVELRGGPVGFAVDDRTIRVENEGASASYRVVLPRSLRDVSVRVGTRVIYERGGGEAGRDLLDPADRRFRF